MLNSENSNLCTYENPLYHFAKKYEAPFDICHNNKIEMPRMQRGRGILYSRNEKENAKGLYEGRKDLFKWIFDRTFTSVSNLFFLSARFSRKRIKNKK